MNNLQTRFKIITPCFCAGADQSKAEVRVPSIRGQLRWWFRVLGGTLEMERNVFGGITRQGTEEQPQASKVRLRLTDVKKVSGQRNDLPQDTGQRLDYLLYYARKTGNPEGIRYQSNGWLAPESSFSLHLSFRKQLSEEEMQIFRRAWDAFLLLGSLGLRQTRGMGALQAGAEISWADFRQACHTVCPEIGKWFIGDQQGRVQAYPNWKEVMIRLEAVLGWIRQHGFSVGIDGSNPTPLGKSMQGRQASALHLRPVLLKEGFLPILFYTPSILEPNSRRDGAEKLLHKLEFKFPYQQKKVDANQDSRRSLFVYELS